VIITRNITVRKVTRTDFNKFKVTRVESPRVVKSKGNVVMNVDYANVQCMKSTFSCGEVMGGHKVVYLKAGKVWLADKDNSECVGSIIGMSNQAGIEDGIIEVIMQGVITLNPWGLTQDTIYYLGADGAITATVTATGILYKIGYAKDSNNLVINHNLLINRN